MTLREFAIEAAGIVLALTLAAGTGVAIAWSRM